MDESLHKICHCPHNVLQNYYVLDTLVSEINIIDFKVFLFLVVILQFDFVIFAVSFQTG